MARWVYVITESKNSEDVENSVLLRCLFPANPLYRSNLIQINIATLLSRDWQWTLKFIWECRGLRMAKAILKKSNTGWLILPDFKTYYQPTIIRTVWYWPKHQKIDQWKRVPWNRLTFMGFLTKTPKQSNRKRISFSTNSIGITEYSYGKKWILTSTWHCI